MLTMKTRMNPSRHIPCLALASLGIAAGSASAANQSWNTGGPTDNWSASTTTNLNWDGGVAWSDNNTANFSGTGEGVSVTGTVMVAGLNITGNNFSFSGSGLRFLTDSSISVGSGHMATFIGGVAGTNIGTLTITGGGTVKFIASNKLFTGTLKIDNGSTLQLGANSSSIDYIKDANSMTVDGRLSLWAGTGETINALNGASTGIVASAGGTRTLTVGSSNGMGNFAGSLQDGGGTASVVGFTKIGSGSQTLSGINSYTGATNLNAGTLLINGNNSAATGNLTAAATTILGGTGTIGAALTTVNGAITGGSLAAIGTLSTRALAFTSTASLLAQINSSTMSADKLAVTGDFELGSATLTLDDLAVAQANNGTLTLVSYTGSLTGSFHNAADDSTILLGGNAWMIDYGTGTNSAITLTAVPEPAGTLLGGLGLLALLRRRATPDRPSAPRPSELGH